MSYIMQIASGDDVHEVEFMIQPSYADADAAIRSFSGAVAKYADEEGDLCLLLESTFEDFLASAQQKGSVSVLRIELPESDVRLPKSPSKLSESSLSDWHQLDLESVEGGEAVKDDDDIESQVIVLEQKEDDDDMEPPVVPDLAEKLAAIPEAPESSIDSILLHMEAAAEQVDICQSSKVKLPAAELEFLKTLERGRDFMNKLVMKTDDGRQQLMSTFGGDCSRIVRARAVLEMVVLSESNANDQRVGTFRDALETLEQVLQDMGLGWQLREANKASHIHRSKSVAVKTVPDAPAAEDSLYSAEVSLSKLGRVGMATATEESEAVEMAPETLPEEVISSALEEPEAEVASAAVVEWPPLVLKLRGETGSESLSEPPVLDGFSMEKASAPVSKLSMCQACKNPVKLYLPAPFQHWACDMCNRPFSCSDPIWACQTAKACNWGICMDCNESAGCQQNLSSEAANRHASPAGEATLGAGMSCLGAMTLVGMPLYLAYRAHHRHRGHRKHYRHPVHAALQARSRGMCCRRFG